MEEHTIRTQILKHAIPVSYLELLPRDVLLLLESIWTDPDEIMKIFEISAILRLRYWEDENGYFWILLYQMYIRQLLSDNSIVNGEEHNMTFHEYLYGRLITKFNGVIINHENLSIRDLYLKVIKYYKEQNMNELIKYGAFDLLVKLINKDSANKDSSYNIDDPDQMIVEARKYVKIFDETIEIIVIMEYMDIFDLMMSYCDLLPKPEVLNIVHFQNALERASFYNNQYLFTTIFSNIIESLEIITMKDEVRRYTLDLIYWSYYNFLGHYELEIANSLLPILAKHHFKFEYSLHRITNAAEIGNIRGIEHVMTVDIERYNLDQEKIRAMYLIVAEYSCISGKLDTIKYFANQLKIKYGLIEDVLYGMLIGSARSGYISAYDYMLIYIKDNGILISDEIYMYSLRYSVLYDRIEITKYILTIVDHEYLIKHIGAFDTLSQFDKYPWLLPILMPYLDAEAFNVIEKTNKKLIDTNRL